MKEIFDSPYRNLFVIGLLLALITAYFGIGSYHADEYFQIIEFANYKLGGIQPEELAWEFHQKMRPSIQPAIAYVFVNTMQGLGIHNPWGIAFLLRGVTAIVVWLLMVQFILQVIKEEKNIALHIFLIILVYFLWFSPFLISRFSSENFSAFFLILGVFLLEFKNVRANWWRAILVGFIFALSFYVRFQIAFALIGVGVYIIFINRENWKTIGAMLTGFALGVALNILIDFWFYDEWVFTPWEYYRANIIEQKSAEFGVSPFYQYVIDLFGFMAPFSLILIPLAVWGAIKNPKSIYVFMIVPFFLAHSAVGHKEIRFLFPMFFPFVVLVYFGAREVWRSEWIKGKEKAIRNTLLVFLVLNLVLLGLRVMIPAQVAFAYFKVIYEEAQKQELILIGYQRQPIEYVSNKVNFYTHENATQLIAADTIDLKNKIKQGIATGSPVYVLSLGPKDPFRNWEELEPVYNFFPRWIYYLNFNDWVSRARVWTIYKVNPEKVS